jgi:hypothetical protein
VVTGSVFGFPSASLLVVSQLECPVSFFVLQVLQHRRIKQPPGTFASEVGMSPTLVGQSWGFQGGYKESTHGIFSYGSGWV